MQIFIDESGDFGWKLDQPFRSGGSSKYFVVCYLSVPVSKRNRPKKRIENFYKKYSVPKSEELKGSLLEQEKRKWFCEEVVLMLKRDDDIKLGTIVLDKKSVPTILRTDSPDIIHSHMIHLGVTKHAITKEETRIVPDLKSVKKTREKSLSDYLKSRAWFDNKEYVKIEYHPAESHTAKNLIFIDWIVNSVWRHYEDNDSDYFNILKPHLDIEELTF